MLSKGVTEQEVEAWRKASMLKKRDHLLLEDERRIHSMLIPQMEHGRTLAERERA